MQKSFNEITAANIALPKLGQDIGTSAAATLQVWLGADRFLFSFSFCFNFTFFNLSSQAGWTINESPNFGNADR